MVDRETVERRLLKLEQTLRKLTELSEVGWDEFADNEGIRDRAERNLHVAAQICIDIGSHVIADRGYRTPHGYGDIFTVLHEEGLLPKALTVTMKSIAGFRNVLVHDYLDVDPKIVYESLKKTDDFRRFAEYVVSWF
ncbi:type VII toxin-antitoxin system HepT family RNase toxin [Desulfolucanica intricata]|uniref:type VII toxin-antitoxin system HepT family RNase toxin n=1 Tax=Desulfolucanica intricata TaxID=1285191 RepID=UPI00135207D9|nr:DUF86 domain-containing protein [Desulfolucanica intricata]